ncbi:hypothetical protein ACFQLX_07520 [Streptomyces polyrhachis]|uniref:Uncharacterized protein n=1 Tax=Streptomyces polyrhachis TaxID=1282885 RepID=A0ABW2GB58_9ACTN
MPDTSQSEHRPDPPPHPDAYTRLSLETQATLAAVQERQTETLAELAQTSARMTELMRRLSPLPGRPPQPSVVPAAVRLLDAWRREHRLDETTCTVAAYILPRLLEQGALIAPPALLARRTGLTPRAAELALKALLTADCLRVVHPAAPPETAVYELGPDLTST